MLPVSLPTSGAFLICMAMFWNGAMIGTEPTMVMKLILKVLGPVSAGWFAAAIGPPTRTIAGLRVGAAPSRAPRPSPSGSGL